MSKLMDINSWHTHGQVISAEDAKSIGLTVIRVRPDNAGRRCAGASRLRKCCHIF